MKWINKNEFTKYQEIKDTDKKIKTNLKSKVEPLACIIRICKTKLDPCKIDM